MAKVKYSKYDVYDFLESKKHEIINKKLEPIDKKIKDVKQKYIDGKFPKDKIEKISKTLEEYIKATSEVDFDYGTYASKVYDSSSELNKLYSTATGCKRLLTDQILLDVQKTIDWSYCPDLDQLQHNSRETRNDIIDEFKKLEEMVKSCKDGAQAVIQLQKLGFDTSSINPTSGGNSLLVSDLNNELLGLPEEGTKPEEENVF